jgi:hypothetical protein
MGIGNGDPSVILSPPLLVIHMAPTMTPVAVLVPVVPNLGRGDDPLVVFFQQLDAITSPWIWWVKIPIQPTLGTDQLLGNRFGSAH